MSDERLAAAARRAAHAIDDECETMADYSEIAAIIQREIAPLFAEASADTARLDWLCSDDGPMYRNSSGEWHWGYIECHDAFGGSFETMRDAIDAQKDRP